MTRALLWKELREQWIIWLSLLLVVLAGVFGFLGMIGYGRDRDEAVLVVFSLAAWVYGLICGAQLFAGESEDGTQTFLDCMPGTRGRLWFVKTVAGALFLAILLAVLMTAGVLAARGHLLITHSLFDVAFMAYWGCIGYCWGLFCGAFASSVLSALGWALLFQSITAFASYVLAVTVSYWAGVRPFLNFSPVIFIVSATLVSIGAATRARSLYCRTDGLRDEDADPRRRLRRQPGWDVLFWLTWSRARSFAVGMAVFGFFSSILVVFLGIFGWVLATTLTGIICGITTFADEQQSGALRFAGDQRFPLGRIWLSKAFIRFAIGLMATVLTALGTLSAGVVAMALTSSPSSQQLQTTFLRLAAGGSLLTQPILFFTMWLTCGFSIGVLCGVLFRKPLVAGVIATGLAIPLSILWLPSEVVTGSLSVWQALSVPFPVLLASRVLMRSWVGDRLFSGQVVRLLCGTSIASLLLLAFAIWYRLAEIPKAPDTVDLEAYKRSLPKPEENAGGRLTLSAIRQFLVLQQDLRRAEEAVRAARVQKPPRPGTPRPEPTLSGQANEVSRLGWDPTNAALAEYLDRLFADRWADDLASAADQPTGLFIDPRNITRVTLLPELEGAVEVVSPLIARGYQMQENGRPEVFVQNLRAGLSLARTLRNRSIAISSLFGERVDTAMLQSVERWLGRLDGHPELLRKTLKALKAHDASVIGDREENRKAELLIAVNSFSDRRALPFIGADTVATIPGESMSAGLLSLSLHVPWEEARLNRLLNALASSDSKLSMRAWEQSPLLVAELVSFPLSQNSFFTREYPPSARVSLQRATLLQVALRLYEAEKGKPANKLSDLVPEYVAAIPLDPYDGQPFRYRLSTGESLKWPPDDISGERRPHARGEADAAMETESENTRRVAAGQGILWCVGKDGHDNGGKIQQSPHLAEALQNSDEIYLVPLPPRKR